MEELKEALGLKLSPQQRTFAINYVETMGNGPESAWRAYDCTTRGSARALAWRCLHNEKVVRFIRHLFMAEGADGRALKVLDEAMGATRRVRGRDVPDYRTRLRAAEFVLKHCPQALIRAVMHERLADDDPAA